MQKEKKDLSHSEAIDNALLEKSALVGSRVKLVKERDEDKKLAQLIAQARTLVGAFDLYVCLKCTRFIADSDVNKKKTRQTIKEQSIFERRHARKAREKPEMTPSTSSGEPSTAPSGSSAGFVVFFRVELYFVVLQLTNS